MKVWNVDVSFKLAIGGPEGEPGVDMVRTAVRDMLASGRLGVSQFQVKQVEDQDMYVKDISVGGQ